ncbi:mitochondrial enoyl-[acyl-carrier protein] reductase / trans-2-enoyl-CoA reductase [Geosmithia morbida]|uniref:enoyl-[acyl-carrier-protein] reductase n=1 Tax=Geosmithia morbida TaxID=1094350 RepID=A0A9P5D5M2_9HYPO|nr:mitochondrial enoyl-[acyl-carrier protein] reductase / trans-2-enoyl-CoA reductase [Geosmithia morbida]KAF4124696.1 mitochondrial enoyl-[acyl-carrier protein] reductase / trans-2-enoyl-CoA reductase [Geosmithia morbida]
MAITQCLSAVRPVACAASAIRARLGSVRHMSGPYGYTQAKALVFSKYGEPGDVLQLHKHSISPSLPSSSVLVRTLAAPINPADINTVQGTYGAKPAFTSLIGTAEPSALPGNEGVLEVVSTGGADTGLSKGDWVIPGATQLGTWRTHAVVEASRLIRVDKTGLTPLQAATVSVNPCTAYRILRSYGPSAGPGPGLGMRPLEVGSGQWFIQNGANSGVGRAAIQLARLWGLRSINVVRDRDTPEATDALVRELTDLGADVVVPESQFLSRGWRDRLADITRGGREHVGLGLNCVGGKSATSVARSLGDGATMVSYGGMSKQPVSLPVGLLIFKDIRFTGFWLTRWNERDPVGRRHMVNDILDLVRANKFRDVPVDEIRWDWDTDLESLRGAVQQGLEGYRKGKGIFVFGET